MSTITFDYRAPSGAETDTPMVGTLTARLLNREVVDGAFRVIAKITIPLVNGGASVDLSDTDPDTQCWVVEEKSGIPGRRTYYKAVDGDAAFVDLVDVDPDSLQPVNELPSFKHELDDEIAARISGDSGLANDIAVEEAARVAEDAALNTAVDLKAPIASPTFTGTVAGITKSMVGLGNVDNTSDASKPVSTAAQTALDLKANIASPTFTGTVGGVTKSMVGLGNVDNTSDANKPISTAAQTALDLKAPIASPTFTGTVSGVTKAMVGLGNVDNTTDAGKPVSTAQQTALDLKANIASPTFTGTVAGITKSMVGLSNVDNTSDANKPVSTAAQTAFDLKAPLASPTFTGTVAGVTKAMVGLGNVDNTSDASKPVSTATQTALDLKAPIASPTFTGTVAGITKSMVGLGNVDNTTDAGKPVSTAAQTALDLKAPVASPTFTGTVAGITKSMVGLGSVDNTSDAGKPVSTAQQTALNLKANIASPTFTGTVAGITKSMVGLSNVDNTTDAGKPVSTAQRAAILAAAISFNALDYGVVGDGTTNDTTAVQAALDAAAGKGVFFPPGTYLVDPVYISSGTHVFGAGASTIFKRKAATVTNTDSIGVLNVHGSTGTHFSNVLIEALKVDANKANIVVGGGGDPYDVEGVSFKWTDKSTIRDVIAVEATADGFDFDDCTDVLLINIRAENCGGSGVHFSENCVRLRCVDSIAISCGAAISRSGFDVFTTAASCSFENCVAQSCYRGITLGGPYSEAVGCHVYNSTNYGTYLTADNCQVIGCIDEGSVSNNFRVAGSRCTISGCRGVGSTGNGITIESAATRVAVLGTQILNPSAVGIRMLGVGPVTLMGNEVYGAGIAGIAGTSTTTAGIIVGNILTGNAAATADVTIMSVANNIT